MLVLNRKIGESVVIDGGIAVTVLSLKGNRVTIGIAAPRDATVLRTELVKEPPETIELSAG